MCLAIPGQVISRTDGDPLLRTGKVRFGGVIKEVSLACVPDAAVGDYVLVHAGLAISKVDEEEAGRVFAHLRQMEELADLEGDPS
jgi:hydrogenase expression/formation protein HypC